MPRQKDLIGQIRKAVNEKTVSEKFRAIDFEFLKPSSLNFLWKHSNKNKNRKESGNEYFIWLEEGLYKLK